MVNSPPRGEAGRARAGWRMPCIAASTVVSPSQCSGSSPTRRLSFSRKSHRSIRAVANRTVIGNLFADPYERVGHHLAADIAVSNHGLTPAAIHFHYSSPWQKGSGPFQKRNQDRIVSP